MSLFVVYCLSMTIDHLKQTVLPVLPLLSLPFTSLLGYFFFNLGYYFFYLTFFYPHQPLSKVENIIMKKIFKTKKNNFMGVSLIVLFIIQDTYKGRTKGSPLY